MDVLSEYYTVHVVATLNLNKMNADVAHKFAELCGSLELQALAEEDVRPEDTKTD
jgi:hypothetical protein